MNRNYWTLLGILCGALPCTPGYAQNLIENGSFEVHTGPCNSFAPNGAFHNNVVSWYAAGPDPNHGICSVDIYCGQNNYDLCLPGPALIGSDGTRYVGFHTRIFNPPYNEAIYQKLSTPLVEGLAYTLSVDLFTCQTGMFSTGTDDFHLFSNIDTIFPLCPTGSPSVQLLATVPYNTISNTQWGTHSLTFIAPPDCNVLILSGSCPGTENYYYVDNVILQEQGAEGLGHDVASTHNAPTLFPNPITDVAVLDLSRTGADSWELMDVLGRSHRSEGISGTERITIDRGDLPSGTYTIVLRRRGQVIKNVRCTFE